MSRNWDQFYLDDPYYAEQLYTRVQVVRVEMATDVVESATFLELQTEIIKKTYAMKYLATSRDYLQHIICVPKLILSLFPAINLGQILTEATGGN